MGLLITYTRDTGKSVAEATSLTPGDLGALRPAVLRELSRYSYLDRRDRTQVSADRVLDAAFRYIETSLTGDGSTDAVEALRRLSTYVCEQYEVSMVERRRAVRRREDRSPT